MSYDVLETAVVVDVVNAETVMILLLMRIRPPVAVRCHVQPKIKTPKFFQKTKKALSKTVRRPHSEQKCFWGDDNGIDIKL